MTVDLHRAAVWMPWAALTLLLWLVDAGWTRERSRRIQAERDGWAREATWWRGVAMRQRGESGVQRAE